MDKFSKFIKLFEEYNSHTNLMSKKEVQNLAEKHIPDCLSIKTFFDKYGLEYKKILDVGTGGGLPSIPIAIQYPQIDVYALDSIAKKIKFIENTKNELNLQNLFPICARTEDFEQREKFDIVLSRAFAPLQTTLEYCCPFAKQNGYIIAYKAVLAEEELKNSENALKTLKIKFIDKIETFANDDILGQRCLLIFKKIEKTPLKYPRKNNLPRKAPL